MVLATTSLYFLIISLVEKLPTLRVPLGCWKRALCGRLAHNFRGGRGLMCGCHSCWKYFAIVRVRVRRRSIAHSGWGGA